MNIAGKFASGDQSDTEALLNEAAKAAAARELPADFVFALFGAASLEDLASFSADEIASLAAQSYAHLSARAQGKADIRIYNPASARKAGGLAAITVIEIENDDMPFLLDSISGELSEQGLSIRLAAHPIFSVERGDDGKIVEWKEYFDSATILKDAAITGAESAIGWLRARLRR